MSAPTQATPMWRKSSHSPNQANCVELAVVWRKMGHGPSNVAITSPENS
jgi:hypothetical protein